MSAQQYDPNKLGWGAALVTCVFTAALGFGAWTIHKNTYHHVAPFFLHVFIHRFFKCNCA